MKNTKRLRFGERRFKSFLVHEKEMAGSMWYIYERRTLTEVCMNRELEYSECHLCSVNREQGDYSRCYRNCSISHLSYVRWKGLWFISTVCDIDFKCCVQIQKVRECTQLFTECDLLIWPQVFSLYVSILKSNKKINEKYS